MKTWKSTTFSALCSFALLSCQNQTVPRLTPSLPLEHETPAQVSTPPQSPPQSHPQTPFPKAAPISKAEFCSARSASQNQIRLAFDPKNQLSFRNSGGLFNGGVCWWHSLFTRAALYLAIYRPDLPKPNEAQAKKIIHSLASGKRVVEIPGYKNLWEFSAAWQNQIQSKLEEWQRVDGFLKFAWIRGLSGSTQIDPVKLETRLLSFLDRAQNFGEVTWTMFQMKGITAHAGLMIGGEIASPDELELAYIDSNYVGQISSLVYRQGQRSISTRAYGNFVPYLGRTKDLARFKSAAESYCRGDLLPSAAFESLSNDFD